MPDWTRFHAAVVAGSKPYELCRACELAWSWLDLDADDWREPLRHAIRRDAQGTGLQNALSLVRGRLLREQGIAPEDTARFSALSAALAEGRASAAEVELKKRWDTSVAIGAYALELFPAGVANPPDPGMEALNASIPALRAAIEASGSATAMPASLDALNEAIGVFAARGRAWRGQAATDRGWWLGLAWWAYGDAAMRSGRRRDARDATQRAAAFYEAAGDDKDAQACRDRALDIETRYAADFDTVTDRDVRKLLDAQTPLDRVRSLTRLVRTFAGTGDRFEANKAADEAAQLLDAEGYPDPEHAFDDAIDAWIATAVKDCRQNALVARLCEITEHWSAILGARCAACGTSQVSSTHRPRRPTTRSRCSSRLSATSSASAHA
jgi:hypothetical protein